MPPCRRLRQSTDTLTDVFSYTMRDTAGATSTTTLTVTIHGANDAPTLAAQTGSQNATVGSAFSLVLPAGTFTDVDAGDSLTYTATAADGSALPAWLSFNAATRTFSGTPAAANVGTLGVKVSATDLGGLAASETFNIAVATAPTTVSLFTASNTPAQTNLNDGSPLEVGVKFQSSVAGQITALKFYRSAGDTGADLLDLWTLDRNQSRQRDVHEHRRKRLADREPVDARRDSANTTYVASYHTTGFYVATDNFFTTAFTSGVLTAPSTTTAGGNGVYAYGGTSHHRHLPDQHLRCRQLLGRCGLRQFGAEHRADGGRRHGRCHREGRHCQWLGRLARHRQCADQRHRSRRRRHQDRHRGQLRRGGRHAWHSARRSAWQPRAQCLGAFTYTVNETDAAVQALAAIDRYADRRLQLHHARYGRRHIHDDAHGHHSRRQRRADACGADRQPERDRRLGLLSGAARRHLHRRRCRRHASPTRRPPPTARRFPPG